MQAKKSILDLFTRISATYRGVCILCFLVVLSGVLSLVLFANSSLPFTWGLLVILIPFLVNVLLAWQLLPQILRRPARLVNTSMYGQQVVVSYLDTAAHKHAGLFPQPSAINVLSRLPTMPLIAPLPTDQSLMATRPVAGSPLTRLIVSTGLDVGLKRKDRPNEDSLLALQNIHTRHDRSYPVGLFVIADGMGGHGNGQEASRMVIQSLNQTVAPTILSGQTNENLAELLVEGVRRANGEVYQRNSQDKSHMGTTIAAALVIDTTTYIVNAGDSRVYLYRASSGLSQVTRDHSTVALLVENGLIEPEDVYIHPRRNEIYCSLGHDPDENFDMFTLDLQPEDLLLLCSDGLWEMVRDTQIQHIIASTISQPEQISAFLVQAALDNGGADNVSVITVCLKAREKHATVYSSSPLWYCLREVPHA